MAQLVGRVLSPGSATGVVLKLDEPLSLWGGLDPATGILIDPHHPQHGELLTGRVVVMPAARGSSSSSSVLAEAVRSGHAPAAIVLGDPDVILAVGAAVAEELYGVRLPVIAVAPDQLTEMVTGRTVTITEDGTIEAV